VEEEEEEEEESGACGREAVDINGDDREHWSAGGWN
jgi:hypothetical protein